MGWADRIRQLRVRVNADTPADAHRGPRFRRRGHRPLPHRAHVLRRRPPQRDARDDRRATTRRAARRALGQAPADAAHRLRRVHLPRHGRLPVTIRLLDPAAPRVPPTKRSHELDVGAPAQPAAREELQQIVERLARGQPDAGPPRLPSRRLSIRKSPPCRPARSSKRRARIAERKRRCMPEVMIPLGRHECDGVPAQASPGRRARSPTRLHRAQDHASPISFGTMIELPRAAVTADEIAKDAHFFSFGTNDLTQTTLGLLARRRRQVPPRNTSNSGIIDRRSLPSPWTRRRRRASSRWRCELGRGTPPRPQARHLRRARRRARHGRLLRSPGV